MSVAHLMIDTLKQATEMVRTEGAARPTFVVVSPEGTYNLICTSEAALEAPDETSLNVVSALLRWSMTRAFIVACEHKDPACLAVYMVTADDAEGFTLSLKRRPLRFGDIACTRAPPHIQRLRTLIPDPVSRLSPADVLDLEDAFEMDLEECRPFYVS